MQDPEDVGEIPMTLREYLKQSKGTIDTLAWLWRELKTPQAVNCARHLVIAVVVATAFAAIQWRVFAIAVNGLAKLDLKLTIAGLGGFFLCVIAQKIADYQHSISRERTVG